MTMIEARIARDLETILDLAEKNGTLGCLKSVAIYFDEMELRAIVKSLREVMPDVAQSSIEDLHQRIYRRLYPVMQSLLNDDGLSLLWGATEVVAKEIAAQPPAAPVETTCCKGLAPTWECRCEIERKAAGHPPYHRSSAGTSGQEG